MTKVDPYQNRLFKDIHHWSIMYKNRAANDREKYWALSTFLQDFENFGSEYVEHFEQMVIAKKIFDPKETTEEHIRHKALQTILDEWTIISRVVEQRQRQRYHTWLTEADAMTKSYLPKGAPGVVTYLGKANVIRHNLYSAISVASIPRDQYNGEDYWMAGPHEIGHQVFWNLDELKVLSGEHKRLGDQVRRIGESVADARELAPEQRQCLARMMGSWLEETFADVYGTLVGDVVANSIKKDDGVSFSGSIMNILKRRIGKAEDLFIDDRDHPIPYLRPLARIKVLEIKGKDTSALRSNWQTFVDSLGADIGAQHVECYSASTHPARPTPPVKGAVKLSVSVVKEALDKVVKELLPVAEKARETGIYSPTSSASAFQSHKNYTEELAQDPREAYKLLLRPLSTASGEIDHPHWLGGYHGEGEEEEFIWHAYEWHSHD